MGDNTSDDDKARGEIEAYMDDLADYVDQRAKRLGAEPTTILIVADHDGRFAMRARNSKGLAFVQLLLEVALAQSRQREPDVSIRIQPQGAKPDA